MHGGLNNLQIDGLQLAQGIGGIDQALQAGGADHQPSSRLQGLPHQPEDITEGAAHLKQHPVRARRQLGQALGGHTRVDMQVADAEAALVALQQLDRIRVPLQGVHLARGHQPGNLQGQGAGAAAHIPHQGIGAGPQMGQQHHAQFHRRGAEARGFGKQRIGQPRGDEIPLEGAVRRRVQGGRAQGATTLTVSGIWPGQSRRWASSQASLGPSTRSPGISNGIPGG